MSNSNIISLNIKNLNENFYIDMDKRFLYDFKYLYKTIITKLIFLFGNKFSINNKAFMYNIFYYKNNIKQYIFMTILDESLVLDLDDINYDFFLIKSELLEHEQHIIKINHLYLKKYWNSKELWTNESFKEIEEYLHNNSLKIYNKNLMIILNKNKIDLKYAADELLNDKDFLLPLIDNNINCDIVCTCDNDYILPIPIRYDLDIINITFKYYHRTFMYLSKELRHNIDVVLAALKANNQISVLSYTSIEIREKLKKMNINIPDIAGSLYDTDTHEY